MADDTRKLFPLRMSEEEHARIRAAAEAARQSMNEWILTAIERRLDYESRPELTYDVRYYSDKPDTWRKE